jgi:hypothetical protein
MSVSQHRYITAYTLNKEKPLSNSSKKERVPAANQTQRGAMVPYQVILPKM